MPVLVYVYCCFDAPDLSHATFQAKTAPPPKKAAATPTPTAKADAKATPAAKAPKAPKKAN